MALRNISLIAATITTGFGINAFLRPAHALTFFEFTLPTVSTDKKTIEALMMVYAVRDIFMGIAIWATAIYGNRKALGWIMLALGGAAFVDGYACKTFAGQGEWAHWGYAPVAAIVGTLLLAGQ